MEMEGVSFHRRPPQLPRLFLSVEDGEPAEKRVGRAVAENPVVILSRQCCCMCLVMKRLLESVGVYPTVVVLEDDEMAAVAKAMEFVAAPAVFVGGELVGGLERLIGLHLSGQLQPRLREVGALCM